MSSDGIYADVLRVLQYTPGAQQAQSERVQDFSPTSLEQVQKTSLISTLISLL